MKKKVLFIGRFQPFHKGHLGTIKKILQVKDVGDLIIGIGSSNVSHTPYNPFTAEEREEMIKSCLSAFPRKRESNAKHQAPLIPNNLPIKIVHIPDIPDNDEWTKVLLERYFDGEVVYSGNSLVIELLTKVGKEVRTPPPIDNPSGTEIRKLIAEGKAWEEFVPKEVVKVIKKVNGIERISMLLSK